MGTSCSHLRIYTFSRVSFAADGSEELGSTPVLPVVLCEVERLRWGAVWLEDLRNPENTIISSAADGDGYHMA